MKTKCVINRAVAVIFAALNILAIGSQAQQLSVPPVVGSDANIINIDDSYIQNEYFGDLYVGEKREKMSVLYDTMSDWTVLSDDYEIGASATAQTWIDQEDGGMIYNDVLVGPQVFSGPMYNETMCLIHGEDYERLCIRKYPFILAPISDGFYSYQGVVGLSHGEMNYMKFLKNENVIEDHVVAFNYDTTQQTESTVRFGSFDTTLANEEKLFVVPNAGHRLWTLRLDAVMFNNEDLMDHSGRPQVAFIDSGNTTLQFPMDVYRKIYDEIKKIENENEYIRVRESFDFPAGRNIKIIKVNTECENIIDKLPSIKYNLAGGVSFEIKPSGYIYSQNGDFFCKIGISGIDDHTNIYRLGTQFLKNFYTVLDFDNNDVMIGSKTKDAIIDGPEDSLYKPPQLDPLPEPEHPTDPETPETDDQSGSSTDEQAQQEETKDDDQTQSGDEQPQDQQDQDQKQDDEQKDTEGQDEQDQPAPEKEEEPKEDDTPPHEDEQHDDDDEKQDDQDQPTPGKEDEGPEDDSPPHEEEETQQDEGEQIPEEHQDQEETQDDQGQQSQDDNQDQEPIVIPDEHQDEQSQEEEGQPQDQQPIDTQDDDEIDELEKKIAELEEKKNQQPEPTPKPKPKKIKKPKTWVDTWILDPIDTIFIEPVVSFDNFVIKSVNNFVSFVTGTVNGFVNLIEYPFKLLHLM